SGAVRSNGAGRPEISAPVVAAPQPVAPEVSAPIPVAVAGEESSAVNLAAGEGEPEEAGTTSEYPALNNGTPAAKRRQRRRKAK
ncbi:MAG TPA: hypothetical protein VGF45_18710, partial [Polyangia bacterium]